jgi:protein arginine N-methyltransferase 1
VSLLLDEHRHYLADRVRIERYAAALVETVRPGDVVLDLASGTGILGLLAVRAGASRVYAIEVSPLAGVAERIASANGLQDVIRVIRSEARHADLPERVDVVVTDQIGRFGFEAGLFSLFADARTRLLKPGGTLVPSALSFVVAPVEHARQFARMEFWRRRPGGFDFSPVAVMAENTGYPARLGPQHLLSEPRHALDVDLSRGTPNALRLDASFTIARAGVLHGIGGWFEARLSRSVTLTNSPLHRRRMLRRQAFMPIGTPLDVNSGDEVGVEIRILPDPLVLAWTVTAHRAGQPAVTFSHATLRGMLFDEREMRLTDPASRPALTARGVARRTVLELCDGQRTLGEIETVVFDRHADLFASREDAAVFVSEVVTRYTHAPDGE